MATAFRLITIQTSKEKYVQEAEQLYLKKLKPLCIFEIQKIKSGSAPRSELKAKIEDEGKKIQKILQPGSIDIVFDEKGTRFSSEEFADLLQKFIERSPKTINFIIGGAFGLSEEIKKNATQSVSLSSFVFNHHVAEIVVLEQIYRAFSIINKTPYHNA
ncbi:MAG: 23S rRNA (pseudouridine(1915)-N(3))-methyltransferase RlmH [Bdellovibrionales bacterium]